MIGRLRLMLQLRDQVPARSVPARIVRRERSPDRVLTIDRGSTHGVADDQAVIAPQPEKMCS